MKQTKKQLGHFTDLYKLEGEENLKQRYIAYNNILFENINVLARKEKQVIVINEVGNGGVIFGSVEYADLAFKRLKEALKSQNKYPARVSETIEGDNKKIAFSINDKWKIEL